MRKSRNCSSPTSTAWKASARIRHSSGKQSARPVTRSSESLEKSRHAHAFATLKKEGKHFDPECLECHVVGLKPWQPPEDTDPQFKKWEGLVGFLSPELTPHMMNVQCENCHGPRGRICWTRIRSFRFPTPETCVSCHHGSHSPLFDFEKYWPKIQHK